MGKNFTWERLDDDAASLDHLTHVDVHSVVLVDGPHHVRSCRRKGGKEGWGGGSRKEGGEGRGRGGKRGGGGGGERRERRRGK